MPIGATIAGLLGIRVLSTIGWRALFIVGGAVPIAAAVLLKWALPESPRYLARHPLRWAELTRLLRRMGHVLPDSTSYADPTEGAAVRAPIGALFHIDFRSDTFALWSSFFFCLLAVYLGFSWLPSLLTGAGFSPGVASTGITAFNLGGAAGAIAGGFVISRIGSRSAMLTMTAGAIAGAIGLSTMTIGGGAGLTPILLMLTLTGGLINAVQTTMYALATHVYPSAMRATGVGTAVAIGRLGAILSGYAGAWALEYRGSALFFWLMAAAMGVCFVSLASVHRHVAAAGGGSKTSANRLSADKAIIG
jgi:AAHS family 4-hydroxybenzoate transporter-like MFS transporter